MKRTCNHTVALSMSKIQKRWTWQRNAGVVPEDNLGEGAVPHSATMRQALQLLQKERVQGNLYVPRDPGSLASASKS